MTRFSSDPHMTLSPIQMAAVVLLGALVSACMAPKSSIRTIDVPAGLSENQVEFAILAALAENPPPEGLSPELEITDRALRAWFGHHYESSGRWFLEGREPNRVLAGYQRRDYYLRVAVIYSATTIEFVVDESRDLRETENYIHKSAVRWIQDLEIRIRRYLGQVALS